jgi:hypothetical protein
MEMVYYSIASLGDPKYDRQWIQSIRSLRLYNQNIPIHLLLYNRPSPSILAEAGRRRVTVHMLGEYRDRLRELLPKRGNLLSSYPTFHKVLSLRSLPADTSSRVLYLDCDTFFFGDVAALFHKYRAHHFYAREEPWSRRSHYGYRPSYFDEDRLRETAHGEGLAFVAPYNTGICLFNHGVSLRIGAASRRFLSYAWRLLVGICHDSGLGDTDQTDLFDRVRPTLVQSDLRSRLLYPSGNWWILEEVAILLTLGGIPDLSHDVIRRADALQNGEFSRQVNAERPTVVHYYSHMEKQFFRRVPRLGRT